MVLNSWSANIEVDIDKGVTNTSPDFFLVDM